MHPIARRLAATVALGPLALAAQPPGPARAQEASVRLDQIAVEGSGAAPAGPGIGNGSATSGGGGGPSGVVGYTARVSPTATKTNTPLIETPQSVSVVTRQQLNDRNVQSLNEAISYTPGVSANVFGFDPRFDAFYIRGFNVTNVGIYRDGLRQPSAPFAIPKVEPYGLDAITILRGPAGGLYGLGSPGGIVDVTSKRPTATPFGEVWLQRGQYDRYQGNFDVGGPIEGSDGRLLYRLTGAVRQSNNFLPGGIDDRAYIAPAFTWKPSADTTFTVLAEYLNNTVPGNVSFYSDFTDPRFQKTRLFSGDPAFQNLNTEQYRIGYAFEHKFSPDIIFRQNFRYYHVDADLRYTEITPGGLSADLSTAARDTGRIANVLDTFSVDNQLELRGATGAIQHTLVGGIDYTYATYSQRSGFGLAPDLQLGGLIRPNYGAQFIPVPDLGNATRVTQSQLGTYVQDQARLGRFILTLTGRHDGVTTTSGSVASPGTATEAVNRAFSERVGLNYLLTDDLVPLCQLCQHLRAPARADPPQSALRADRRDADRGWHQVQRAGHQRLSQRGRVRHHPDQRAGARPGKPPLLRRADRRRELARRGTRGGGQSRPGHQRHGGLQPRRHPDDQEPGQPGIGGSLPLGGAQQHLPDVRDLRAPDLVGALRPELRRRHPLCRHEPGKRCAEHLPQLHRHPVRRGRRLRLRQGRSPAPGHAPAGERHQPARPQLLHLPGGGLLPRPAPAIHREPDLSLVIRGPEPRMR
ncbi:Vitamin B12 transporter BtuB [Methylobacterium soli]|nr:Vitamin B12 transporter BtuB [Methylobacterium soli]